MCVCTFFNLLKGFVKGFLLLLLKNSTEMVKQSLHRKWNRDDDRTNSGDDPRRSKFKRHTFSSVAHFSDFFSPKSLCNSKKKREFSDSKFDLRTKSRQRSSLFSTTGNSGRGREYEMSVGNFSWDIIFSSLSVFMVINLQIDNKLSGQLFLLIQ